MPLYTPTVVNRWLTNTVGGQATSNQAFTAGTVLLMQVFVPATCQIDGVAYITGSGGPAGNVIGGLVGPVSRSADSPDGAVVVAQSASTAQVGTAAVQLLTWTAVTVRAGIYYATLEGDNAAGTYTRYAGTPQATGLSATYARAGGYGALTDPTPATSANSAGPGLRLRVV